MIKKYNQFIFERNNIEQTNEGMKDWLAAFMMLVGVGVVPVSVSTADAKTKKEFVESQPQDKLDAAKFVDYINKVGVTDPIDKIWMDFIKDNAEIKSNLNDVKKYINKDGKVYHFDKKYQEQVFTNVDIHEFSPVNYLTDMGSFIEDSQEPTINNFISEYQKKTSVEICIITVPSLNDEDPFQYSLDQFNRIGVGKKSTNNGILIMVSMNDRKWEIRTGKGVEGLLPDISCSHIGNDILKSHFKEGDYYGGIMAALTEIASSINKNPDDIKKFIETESKKNQEANMEILENVGMSLLVLGIISTLLILVYRKWDNANDMLEEITDKMKEIEKMKNSISESGVSEVDELYNKFKDIIDKNVLVLGGISKSGEKPKLYQIGKHADFLLNQKKRVASLNDIYVDIENSYSDWRRNRERLSNIESLITGYSLGAIISSIDLGFQAWNKLKTEYGVDTTYDKDTLKSKASELTSIVNKVDNAYKTSLSSAETIVTDFNNKKGNILSSISNVRSTLSKYTSAEDKLKNWKSLVDSSLSNMNRFKQWAQSSEKGTIDKLVDTFSKDFGDKVLIKSYILTNEKLLDNLIREIEEMTKKWKDRKEEEERQEYYRREEAYRMRRDSYSSSSSSSSSTFGGFGGGSSGGGGAGGSW